jgi:hypothetical protein
MNGPEQISSTMRLVESSYPERKVAVGFDGLFKKVCIGEDDWCWEERQRGCLVLLRSDEVPLEGLQAVV